MNSEEISETWAALNECGGNRKLTAELLGITESELSNRVVNDKRLNAIYGKDPDKSIPVVADQMVRTSEDIPEVDPEGDLVTVVDDNNRGLLAKGLREAGISDSTLDRIETLGKFEKSAGRFLVSSMDLMHRLVVFGAIQLFEDLEYIRSRIRSADTDKEKLMWQRAFNITFDQLQKANRDIQAGTLAMAKLTPKKREDDAPKKPAFRPLRDAKEQK